jgi:hypothetical protein
MGRLLGKMRWQIWIACLAILFNALAPTIAHALVSQNGPTIEMEVCSATGPKFISVDQATGEPSRFDSSLHHLEHCPFCLTQADSFALPGHTSTRFSVIGGHDAFPALFYQSPSPLFSWSTANPRAPPAMC